MKPIKFLGLCALGYATLLAAFGPGEDRLNLEPVPSTYVSPIIVRMPLEDPVVPVGQDRVTVTTPGTSTSTTMPEPLVGPDTPCQEWIPLAVENGWPRDRQILETLASVMYRESRCLPMADSGPDHGLTQINAVHADYLNMLGWTHDDMKDPAKNLYFAWLLYSEREAAGKCGWQPWSLKCS